MRDPTTCATVRAMNDSDLEALDAALRADIRRLGTQLGDALVRQHGQPLLDRVEQVRAIARELRRDQASTKELADVLGDVDLVDAIHLVRAFTVYFHLANTAEQVHRIDDLNITDAGAGPRFAETVGRLRALGSMTRRSSARPDRSTSDRCSPPTRPKRRAARSSTSSPRSRR